MGDRARYSNYVKDQVRKRYHLCRTTADKQALADELGIGSVPKLYNLASRLGATERDPEDHGPSFSGEAHAEERLLIREDPTSTSLGPQGERYLRDEFGRRTIEEIAYHLHHSETAILYTARKLGLRKPVKYWNTVKVALWFGISVAELREKLIPEGVDVFPLGDKKGRVVLELASTTSLARWLQQPGSLEWLREHNADEFFIAEIEESVDDLVEHRTQWELCKYLSHGHVCQNPFAGSFGLFCTNNDRYQAGDDPRCSARTLALEDLRPDGYGEEEAI